MKYIKIFITLIVLSNTYANAQLSTNLILSSRPDARLSNWITNKAILTLVVSNTQMPIRAKIKATLKTTDGAEVSSTNLSLARTITFGDGNTTLNADAVYPLEVQNFTNTYQLSLNKAGKLPSGSYQLCIDLVNDITFVPIAQQRCRIFFVATQQLPIAMLPAANQIINEPTAQTAILFRWTPLSPKPTTATHYRLQVFEVLANQLPMQALRSNQPILDQIVIERTQYIWQTRGIINSNANAASDSAQQYQQYIWSIQSLDEQDNPVAVDGNYEGRSEPQIFIVKPKLALLKK